MPSPGLAPPALTMPVPPTGPTAPSAFPLTTPPPLTAPLPFSPTAAPLPTIPTVPPVPSAPLNVTSQNVTRLNLNPSVSINNNYVYAVWANKTYFANGTGSGTDIVFTSSNNSGANFSRPITLSHTPEVNITKVSTKPQISSNGSYVAIVWGEKISERPSEIISRISQNHGSTFGDWINITNLTNNFIINKTKSSIPLFSGLSAGNTTSAEVYDLPPITARYLTIEVNGSTAADNTAGVTDLRVRVPNVPAALPSLPLGKNNTTSSTSTVASIASPSRSSNVVYCGALFAYDCPRFCLSDNALFDYFIKNPLRISAENDHVQNSHRYSSALTPYYYDDNTLKLKPVSATAGNITPGISATSINRNISSEVCSNNNLKIDAFPSPTSPSSSAMTNQSESSATNTTSNVSSASSTDTAQQQNQTENHDPRVPVDNNPDTWWEGESPGPASFVVDLGAENSICAVDVKWYEGDERQYRFNITASNETLPMKPGLDYQVVSQSPDIKLSEDGEVDLIWNQVTRERDEEDEEDDEDDEDEPTPTPTPTPTPSPLQPLLQHPSPSPSPLQHHLHLQHQLPLHVPLDGLVQRVCLVLLQPHLPQNAKYRVKN